MFVFIFLRWLCVFNERNRSRAAATPTVITLNTSRIECIVWNGGGGGGFMDPQAVGVYGVLLREMFDKIGLCRVNLKAAF